MSQTFNLVCPETKSAIWVGQRDYLYSDETRIKALAKWLHDHKDKPLFFVNEESALLDDIPEERFVGLYSTWCQEVDGCDCLHCRRYVQNGGTKPIQPSGRPDVRPFLPWTLKK